MKDFRDSAEYHREESEDDGEFFWRMLYEVGGFLFGKIYWTLHDRARIGFKGLRHLLVLIRWSWPIWLTSGVAWCFFGFELWPTVAVTTVAVWLYGRFQPFIYH